MPNVESGLPPQNIAVEQSLLGSVLLYNEAFDDVDPLVSPEDFYRDTHQIVWREIRELRLVGKPVGGP